MTLELGGVMDAMTMFRRLCRHGKRHAQLKEPFLWCPRRTTSLAQSPSQINGNIRASDDRSNHDEDRRHWIMFDGVQNLVVQGGGTFDGNGLSWWQNSCKINKALNTQQIHVSFEKCSDVRATNLQVTTPRSSPNMDGIHVTGTRNIQISSSIIGTGDDCISIVDGSQNVQAMDITCGPGHGISIGSLGSRNSEAHVSGVTVNRATFSGTSNGVRFKTWQNIKGTSASDVAIKFDCSQSFPCEGIVLQNVNMQKTGRGSATASCNNIDPKYMGAVSPHCS
ncbi:hypothetical protein NL676_016882 [Syzygium grande]|nr:hypothetical protein NL676_016882 [Syzygium grande]